MSSEPSEPALELVRRDADACVLAVSGELSLCSAGLVTRAVSKALLDVGRVLVDVSGLRLAWRPAIQVFPSVLAGAGGWPRSRLVVSHRSRRMFQTTIHRPARSSRNVTSPGRCPMWSPALGPSRWAGYFSAMEATRQRIEWPA